MTGRELRSLTAVLADARRRGFLGPGPVHHHVRHALGFARCPAVAAAGLSLDLGSGGGVPGLVLAAELPASTWVLLDAHRARTSFLSDAVGMLGLGARVTVVTARAEDLGRDARHRGRYDVVVARSFGRPAVVAECSAPLLRVGGGLVVSEPPEAEDRWPDGPLSTVGLRFLHVEPGPPRLAVLGQEVPCPDRFPRRVGVPDKRPLW